MKLLKKINGKHTGLFAAGLLLGTAGVKILSSKDAKNVYTKCTAAVLRAKESVMKTVTTVQENAGDIYAEAQQINEDRKHRKLHMQMKVRQKNKILIKKHLSVCTGVFCISER